MRKAARLRTPEDRQSAISRRSHRHNGRQRERAATGICYHCRPIFQATAMASRPLPARATGALLREAKPLRALFGEARRIDRLQHLLESQLQPAAREHCRVASWREGCLLLIVTDGHWATRLRYQQRRLLRQLQAIEEFAGLERIHFKVQPPPPARHEPPRTTPLSACAADNIHATAEGIRDPRLRAALERLASRGKPD